MMPDIDGLEMTTMLRARAETRDLPIILAAIRSGTLDVAAQVSATWPLDAIDDAIAAVRHGEVIRSVLDLS
jgi:Zn-dependent alcohol dehydrogenase